MYIDEGTTNLIKTNKTKQTQRSGMGVGHRSLAQITFCQPNVLFHRSFGGLRGQKMALLS